MKSSFEMKTEPGEETGNKNDKKQPAEVKKEPDVKRTYQQLFATDAEIESKKNISRWNTDGGVDLCP